MTEHEDNTEDQKPPENVAEKTEAPAAEENVETKAEGGGFDLGKVIEDAKRVVTQPVEFFSGMQQTGGFAEPCIFLLVMAVIMGALAMVLSVFGMGHIGAMVIGFGSIIVFPIMALIGSFIGALIMFVIWKLMGSEKDYETAYRCVAYSSVIYPLMPLIGWLPYLGTIIYLGFGMYLVYVATTQVHQIKQQTAQIVIGVLAAVVILVQLSGEYTTRHIQAHIEESTKQWQESAEEMNKAFEKMGKNAEEMTAEEAGKVVGDFLKGLSDAMPEEMKQKMQEAQRQSSSDTTSDRAEAASSASEAVGEAMESK